MRALFAYLADSSLLARAPAGASCAICTLPYMRRVLTANVATNCLSALAFRVYAKVRVFHPAYLACVFHPAVCNCNSFRVLVWVSCACTLHPAPGATWTTVNSCRCASWCLARTCKTS